MSDTNLSSKRFAYALLAIVGTAVLYLFGFTGGLEIVSQAAQQRADNQASISALQKKASDLKKLQQQFALYEDQVNALSVAMPAEKQMAEVITMLETIAARAGIMLENVQPNEPTPDGLPLTVSVRGSFGATLAFVEFLEKNVRPFLVGPMTLAGGGADIAATFDVVVLYQVPPENMSPTETEAGS